MARSTTPSGPNWMRRSQAVGAAKARGVQTIVDPTAMFGGRDVRFMKQVADQTGVRIVACTGIYSYDYLPHYFENRDADVMAEHFVSDLQDGVQGTEIRAAFLKCAADAAGVTEHIEKIHRAVARASVQTGAPIMAHSMPRSARPPSDRDLPGRGRRPRAGADRPLRRHRRRRLHRAADRQGRLRGLDRYGLEMSLPIDKRNATAAELLRRGHAERVMISQDYCATIDWFPPEAGEVFESSGRSATGR